MAGWSPPPTPSWRPGSDVHYPVPIHLQPAYRDRLESLSLTRTEELAGRVLFLPIYPELTAAQQELVIEATREHLEAS